MSFDIDMSMEGAFSREHLDQIAARIKHRLTQAFRDAGYFLFDFHFEEQPFKLTDCAAPEPEEQVRVLLRAATLRDSFLALPPHCPTWHLYLPTRSPPGYSVD